MNVSGISRPVLVVLIVAAVLLLAYGSTKAAGLLTQHTDIHTQTLAAAPRIVVRGLDRGDVRRHRRRPPGQSQAGRPRRSARSGAAGPRPGVRRHLAACASTTAVTSRPWSTPPASTSYVLEVPRNTDVRVTDRLGDLRAENLAGGVDLSSTLGDLRVQGDDGAGACEHDDGRRGRGRAGHRASPRARPSATSTSWPADRARSVPTPPRATST